jgi:hypothetical protein
MSTIYNLRKYKIIGISIFDLTASIIGMVLLFLFIRRLYFRDLHLWKFIFAALILTIPFGIIIHIFFGVNTSLNYRLGLSNKPL